MSHNITLDELIRELLDSVVDPDEYGIDYITIEDAEHFVVCKYPDGNSPFTAQELMTKWNELVDMD